MHELNIFAHLFCKQNYASHITTNERGHSLNGIGLPVGFFAFKD